MSGSLMDYAVPFAASIPPILSDRVETPSPFNPIGVKGMGESGTIGVTPAVVNAVMDALRPYGVRHLDMPLTAEKVWSAIHQRLWPVRLLNAECGYQQADDGTRRC
jgi:aerobic carbon-monoxide dehydrogenase large subunit